LTQEDSQAMLAQSDRMVAAELLWAAERDRVPMAPLTSTYPGIDVKDAYEIALHNIRRRVAAGATVYGHKVGLSSEAMQTMMGIDAAPGDSFRAEFSDIGSVSIQFK